nr:hypothetical protein [Amycolatopsis vancoresmycina]
MSDCRATAYPQATNPAADGRAPRKTTDSVACGGALAKACTACGASGARNSVPAHIA